MFEARSPTRQRCSAGLSPDPCLVEQDPVLRGFLIVPDPGGDERGRFSALDSYPTKGTTRTRARYPCSLGSLTIPAHCHLQQYRDDTGIIPLRGLDTATTIREVNCAATEGMTRSGYERAAADQIVEAGRAITMATGPLSDPATDHNDEVGVSSVTGCRSGW